MSGQAPCYVDYCEAPGEHTCARCGRLYCVNHCAPLYSRHLGAQGDRVVDTVTQAPLHYCRGCLQGGPQAPPISRGFRRPDGAATPPRAPRRPPQSMTFLALCRVCGAEVYRLERIRRRTKRVQGLVAEGPSQGWLKHALAMRSLGGRTTYEHRLSNWQMRTWRGEVDPDANKVRGLVQTAWVADDTYDPTLQVGDPSGPVTTERYRMLNVLGALGLGHGFNVTRMSDADWDRIKDWVDRHPDDGRG